MKAPGISGIDMSYSNIHGHGATTISIPVIRINSGFKLEI